MNPEPDKIEKKLSAKMKSYSNPTGARAWVDKNFDLIRQAFEDVKIRDFIFEPFKQVFQGATNQERKVLAIITQVAVANAVMAGLPGKMGVGVFVSIGLEFWMAYSIAKAIGIEVKNSNDMWKYFGLFAGVAGTILILFRHLLGFAFSIFSVIPLINPMILPELIVTNFVGILFWFGFEEAKERGSFTIPARAFALFGKRFKELFNYQKTIVLNSLTVDNMKLVGKRLKTFLTGEVVVSKPILRGEVFSAAAMAYLLAGKYDALHGDLGDVFMASIRRAYSDKLGNATEHEIRDFFAHRTPEQLAGDINLVKGEMFERLVEVDENADGDSTTAELHSSRSEPGTDIIFTDSETGKSIAYSLKSSSDPAYIETALKRYPDHPILTTKEHAEHFSAHPMVDISDQSNEHLENVTRDNFDKLVLQLEPIDAGHVASAGVASKAIVSLWPFVVAFLRKRITQEQLEKAFVRVLGESGVALTSRIAYGMILGVVFAWYLLARSVVLIVQKMDNVYEKPNNRTGSGGEE